MTHGKRDEPPPRAVQHSALHRDPGATSRDQRYDNIVSNLHNSLSMYVIVYPFTTDVSL